MFISQNGKVALGLLILISHQSQADDENIYNLSLEELGKLSISSISTLTEATVRVQPASTTYLDNELINNTSASNLIDLLNYHVPETQIVSTKATGHNPAFRGVAPSGPIAHQYLVNGRPLNMKFFLGSLVEASNLMGDINSVEVIHGPGSVIYGSGALTGVINLKQHNINTFEGASFDFKQMFINESTISEIKYGVRTGEQAGFFAYIGFEDQQGADVEDSPVRYSNSFTAINEQFIVAGENATLNISPYQESPHNDVKLFLDYTDGNFSAWYRFSRESERLYIDRSKLSNEAPDNIVLNAGWSAESLIRYSNNYQYKNQSFEVTNEWSLKENLKLNVLLGGDIVDFEYDSPLPRGGERILNHHEEEVNAKALLNYRVNEKNQLALGIETSNHRFYFKNNGAYTSTDPWDVFSYAAIVEQQLAWSDKLTSFVGARIDKSRYSDYLFSPRLAVIYNQSDNQTWKFIANDAVRFPPQLVARLDTLKGEKSLPEESLTSFELSYHHEVYDSYHYELRGFYQSLDAIDSVGGLQDHVGTVDTYGLTALAQYSNDEVKLNLSHSWTDLHDTEILDSIDPSNFTAAGQGYGSNLNAWSNHNTKINLQYIINEKWRIDSSLNILWGYPGSEELGEYNSFYRIGRPNPQSIVIDEGYSEAFGSNVELTAGASYQHSKNLSFRFDVYNIVDAIDDEHNRYQDRNYGTYRAKPLSAMISLSYQLP